MLEKSIGIGFIVLVLQICLFSPSEDSPRCGSSNGSCYHSWISQWRWCEKGSKCMTLSLLRVCRSFSVFSVHKHQLWWWLIYSVKISHIQYYMFTVNTQRILVSKCFSIGFYKNYLMKCFLIFQFTIHAFFSSKYGFSVFYCSHISSHCVYKYVISYVCIYCKICQV